MFLVRVRGGQPTKSLAPRPGACYDRRVTKEGCTQMQIDVNYVSDEELKAIVRFNNEIVKQGVKILRSRGFRVTGILDNAEYDPGDTEISIVEEEVASE